MVEWVQYIELAERESAVSSEAFGTRIRKNKLGTIAERNLIVSGFIALPDRGGKVLRIRKLKNWVHDCLSLGDYAFGADYYSYMYDTSAGAYIFDERLNVVKRVEGRASLVYRKDYLYSAIDHEKTC